MAEAFKVGDIVLYERGAAGKDEAVFLGLDGNSETHARVRIIRTWQIIASVPLEKLTKAPE